MSAVTPPSARIGWHEWTARRPAVAHADAPCGYALLQHAKATLATAAEAASELSYCLCSYECAVEFVLQVDEAQLERMSVAGSLSASMSLPAALGNVTQTF